MARLIDADALKKFPIRIDHYDKEHGNTDFVLGIETVLEYAEHLPTVNAVPVVHGRWEWDIDDIYRCSNCYEKSQVKEVMLRPDWSYCPNCGAHMDLEVG